MPDYHKGKIYKILNTIDNEIYVGSTCELLSQRMARHRSQVLIKPHLKLYKHMNQLGVEHFYIELIEDCPCDRNEELVKREGEIIRSIGTLNKNGTINIKENSTGYHMQYYHDNIEKRKEQKHIWYERNKEHVKEQTKGYKENNKESIKDYYERNKVRIQDYYKRNKEQRTEKYREQRKEYYERNKDTINKIVECECGCFITYSGLTRHKQSNKHKKLFDK